MRALILVDIQNDFCPGGALAVTDGDQVVAVANRLAPAFDLVVATQDWHPADHGSFASQNEGKQVGEMGELEGLPQVMWPDHCIRGGAGAEFHADLDMGPVEAIFRKGTDPRVDSYSGFYDNGQRRSTGLAAFLRGRGVDEVYVMGLATDYCVKFTALDAAAEGFRTILVEDGCRGVELAEGDVARALDELRNAGVGIFDSEGVLARVTGDGKDAGVRDGGDDPAGADELGRGRFLRLVRRNGWEYAQRVDSEGVVVIIAVTDARELVLVEQHRGSLDKRVLELPAGLAGDDADKAGEALEQAARRELEEETGFRAASLERLVEGPVSAGMSSEVLTFYRAKGLEKVGEGGGDEFEDIQVHTVPLDEVEQWVRRRIDETGCIVDPKVFMGAYFGQRLAEA